jgi:hypothetical protein
MSECLGEGLPKYWSLGNTAKETFNSDQICHPIPQRIVFIIMNRLCIPSSSGESSGHDLSDNNYYNGWFNNKNINGFANDVVGDYQLFGLH